MSGCRRRNGLGQAHFCTTCFRPPPRAGYAVTAESEPRLPVKAGTRAAAHPTAPVGVGDELRRLAPRPAPLRLRYHRPCASSTPRPLDPCHPVEKIVKFMCMFRAGDGAGDPGRLVVHPKWVQGRIFRAAFRVHMEIWLVFCQNFSNEKLKHTVANANVCQ